MSRKSNLKAELESRYERTEVEIPGEETGCSFSEDHCPDCSTY